MEIYGYFGSTGCIKVVRGMFVFWIINKLSLNMLNLKYVVSDANFEEFGENFEKYKD
jgi:hypothetical protein